MPRKKRKNRAKLEAAFHEVKVKEPAIVGHTRKKIGAQRAEQQRTAIALDKARRAGATVSRSRKPPHKMTDDELAQAIEAPYRRGRRGRHAT